jgi:hypothetical protein
MYTESDVMPIPRRRFLSVSEARGSGSVHNQVLTASGLLDGSRFGLNFLRLDYRQLNAEWPQNEAGLLGLMVLAAILCLESYRQPMDRTSWLAE